MTDTNPGAQEESPVHTLIRQRERLRTWLSKLGEVATGASSRVAERVRLDYEDRLRRVTEELSMYRDEIGRDLEGLRAELAAAEQRRAQATDVLEEARLRHVIGELDDEEWAEQEQRLQGEVDGAAGEAERARSEVERLSTLAAEVSGADQSTVEAEVSLEPVDTTPEPAAEPDDEDVTTWLEELSASAGASGGEAEEEEGGDLPWLEADQESEAWKPGGEAPAPEFTAPSERPAAAEPADSLADDDLAFLEELDRAISGSPASSSKAPAASPPPAAGAATPPAGAAPAAERQSGGPLLCKECGAINEPHSWYCEVCGSEL